MGATHRPFPVLSPPSKGGWGDVSWLPSRAFVECCDSEFRFVVPMHERGLPFGNGSHIEPFAVLSPPSKGVGGMCLRRVCLRSTHRQQPSNQGQLAFVFNPIVATAVVYRSDAVHLLSLIAITVAQHVAVYGRKSRFRLISGLASLFIRFLCRLFWRKVILAYFCYLTGVIF